MTIRLSSGLRDAVASRYGLGTMLMRGYVQVYSGTQPPTADDSPTGQLLAVITQNGDAVPTADNKAGGLLVELGADYGTLCNAGSWVLTGLKDGTPGWWRYVTSPNDSGTVSRTLSRLDGAVDDSLLPRLTTIVAESRITLAGFLLILPAQ